MTGYIVLLNIYQLQKTDSTLKLTENVDVAGRQVVTKSINRMDLAQEKSRYKL